MTTTATTERKAATGPQEAAGFRLLHTTIRVLDLEKSLDFYTRHLGMKVLRRQDYPGGRFTLAFIGYGDESDHTVIELTHNWDQKEPYSIGTGYGHMAIGVPDIFGVCERMRASSVKIIRDPGHAVRGIVRQQYGGGMDGVLTPERAVDAAAYQLAPLESLRYSPQLKNKALLSGQTATPWLRADNMCQSEEYLDNGGEKFISGMGATHGVRIRDPRHRSNSRDNGR